MNANELDQQLRNVINSALKNKLPVENVMLELDILHMEMMLLRQSIIAQKMAQHQAEGIIAAHHMPNGRAIKTPGI